MSAGYSGDDIADEYEHCAEMCAVRGLKGEAGDPLPELISAECFNAIAANPSAFQERIRQYAYGIAMNRLNLPEDAP